MPKKEPKVVDPGKLEQYQKIVDQITNIYLDQYFHGQNSNSITGLSIEGQQMVNPLIDEELLKLTGEQPDDSYSNVKNDFEIISALRYDPQLVYNPKDTVNHSNGLPLNANDILTSLKFDENDLVDFGHVGNDVYKLPTEQNDYNSAFFFLFDEHFHRLNLTMSYFEFDYHVERTDLLQNLNLALEDLDKTRPYKIRIVVNRDGDVKIEANEVAERFNLFDGLILGSIDEYLLSGSVLWTVHIDTKPTLISPFTSFKTTNRKHYNEARARCLPQVPIPGEQHDVLLYNSALQVMEGSISNVAFRLFDEDSGAYEWHTPVLTSGCLCGVVRHMLLSKGLLKEKLITLKDIKVGDEVLLMNGVMGVVKGILV